MSDIFNDYWDDFDDEVKDFVEEPDSDYDSSNYNNNDPAKLTTAYHLQQGVKAIEQLKSVVEESGWKRTLIKGNTTVFSKSGADDKAPILMSEHVIDGFAPQSIFAVIGMRKLWDPWYEEGNLIENLDETTSLTYMVMRGLPGTKTRDLCQVEKIECVSDDTIYFASTSVMSDKVPQVIDRVRAHVQLNGWILNAISHNPPRTRVTYVLQLKVNGWVPAVMAKKFLLKRPLIVNIIDRYLKKNGPPPVIVSSTPALRPSRSESGSYNSDWTDQQLQQYKGNRKFSVEYEKELRNTSSYHEEDNRDFSLPSSSSTSSPSISPKRQKTPKQSIYNQFPKSPKNERPPVQSIKNAQTILNIPAFSNYGQDQELKASRRQASSSLLEDQEFSSQKTPRRQASSTLLEDQEFSSQKTPRRQASSTLLEDQEFSSQKTPRRQASSTLIRSQYYEDDRELNSKKTLRRHASSILLRQNYEDDQLNSQKTPRRQTSSTLLRQNYEEEEDKEFSPQKTIKRVPSSLKSQTSSINSYNQSSPSSPVIKPLTSIQPGSPTSAQSSTNIKINIPPPPLVQPKLPKKHRHTETVNRAVAIFKDSAKTLHGWNLYTENKGVKIYMKDVAGRSNPIIRGDYTIRGNYTANDFIAAAKNSSMRKLWDDRFSDGQDIEIFDNNEIMTRVAIKGTFPISARDLAICGTIEQDPKTGRITYVTASVIDPAIPEVKKYVRAHLNFTGWQIDPKFDSEGNTKALDIIYIVDIDIKLDSVPSSILKSISTSTPMVVQKLDESIRTTGFPPYVLNSSSKIVSENISLGDFQYELTLVAEDDGITEIRLSRIMYPNGFDVVTSPKDATVESLTDTLDTIKITLPSNVTTSKLQVKITKRTSQGFKATHNGTSKISKVKLNQKKKSTNVMNVTNVTDVTNVESSQDTIDANQISVESTPPHSRSIELPKESENVKQFQYQRSRKYSRSHQQIEPIVNAININSVDSTLVAEESDTFDTSYAPRKQKRLSFSNLPPSIINPEIIKSEEENEVEVTTSFNDITSFDSFDDINGENDYEKYEKVTEEIEEEEIEEFISSNQIKYNKVYNLSKDVIIISENVKLNPHQAALMFFAMILAYYAGKLSL